MTLRQWLLSRPDGRRRIDVLHLVLVSTAMVFDDDRLVEVDSVDGHEQPHTTPDGDLVDPTRGQYRSPWDVVTSGECDAQELTALQEWLESCCQGFWAEFDDIEFPPSKLLTRTDLLDRIICAIRRSDWSALPPDPPIKDLPWGEAGAGAVQDFLGILELEIAED